MFLIVTQGLYSISCKTDTGVLLLRLIRVIHPNPFVYSYLNKIVILKDAAIIFNRIFFFHTPSYQRASEVILIPALPMDIFIFGMLVRLVIFALFYFVVGYDDTKIRF